MGRAPRALLPCRAELGDPRPQRARTRRGSPSSTTHQAEALYAAFDGPTIVTTGTASGKSLCFQLPTLAGAELRPRRARAVPLSDQGAGPGSGARAARLRAAQAIAAGDLRRRHARAGARRDPQAQQPGPHQPRHAARRDPPPPRRLGRAAREPRVRRRRRGARVPRRVRLARRQRAAAAAPRRARSTEPSRASCSPARRSPTRSSSPSGSPGSTEFTPDRQRHRSARRPARRDVEPAAARRGARRPRLGAVRGGGGVLRAGQRAARGRSAS